MKGDPNKPGDWLLVAKADITRTNVMLDGGEPGGAALWCQQAAEKAIKGNGSGGNGLTETFDTLDRTLLSASCRLTPFSHYQLLFWSSHRFRDGHR